MFHNFGFGMTWLGGILMLLFWVGIAALIIWALKSTFASSSQSGSDHSARAILDRRYANGDISREDYQSMKADISED